MEQELYFDLYRSYFQFASDIRESISTLYVGLTQKKMAAP